MAGYLLLAGGAEFGGLMAQPDRRALELAGGPAAPVSIIPTAAAPDHNDQRAGSNGARWFRGLGASNVSVIPVIDGASANDSTLTEQMRQSRLVYLLGCFTGYLGETLKGSLCWQAALEAYADGAVLAGSSAGAMVLCQYYFDPAHQQVVEGLNLLPNTCVLPHHNTFGQRWAHQISALLPDVTLLGIDERTGLLDDGPGERKVSWCVYGQGAVTIYRNGKPIVYAAGQRFEDTFLP
ncbi:MAG TPA: Type 1 glutamine amidotransferase-like domain-containing protein [Ktedonobacteraceae bacterium]|nr:Type 1 glutamine amidotransferase-like domain-containing protein [Ktedonobacteraceae bacterium]